MIVFFAAFDWFKPEGCEVSWAVSSHVFTYELVT